MIAFFLIPLFSVFAGGEDYIVWITDDVDGVCQHNMVNGCVLDIGIVTENPFKWDAKGCTVLGHELFHIWGYEENEIPPCIQNQEFRK